MAGAGRGHGQLVNFRWVKVRAGEPQEQLPEAAIFYRVRTVNINGIRFGFWRRRGLGKRGGLGGHGARAEGLKGGRAWICHGGLSALSTSSLQNETICCGLKLGETFSFENFSDLGLIPSLFAIR